MPNLTSSAKLYPATQSPSVFDRISFVMRGLDPRIHLSKKIDCRVKFTTGPPRPDPVARQ
jgi:hypothetical protein